MVQAIDIVGPPLDKFPGGAPRSEAPPNQSQEYPTLQMSAQFGLAEVSKNPAVAFHRNLIFEDLQRLP
jgi:hypothetical protein